MMAPRTERAQPANTRHPLPWEGGRGEGCLFLASVRDRREARLAATLGADVSQRPLVVDAALLTGTFAVLWIVARISAELDRRSAALRERLRMRRAAASRVSAGAPRSPRATAHSPPH